MNLSHGKGTLPDMGMAGVGTFEAEAAAPPGLEKRLEPKRHHPVEHNPRSRSIPVRRRSRRGSRA